MPNVVRFTLPTARYQNISGVGSFVAGVLDVDANDLEAVSRARFLTKPYGAIEVGIVNAAAPKPTLPAVPATPNPDPYPQYPTMDEIVASPALRAAYASRLVPREVPGPAALLLPLLETPPAVTTNLTATTIAGTTKDWPLTVPELGSDLAGPALLYGAPVFTAEHPVFAPAIIGAAEGDSPPPTLEFVTDGPILEVLHLGVGPNVFRMEIDGQRAQAADYSFTSPGGAQRRFAISFGSRAFRHVKITGDLALIKLVTHVTDTVYAPPGGKLLRAFVLGDSFAQNTYGFQYVAAKLLGLGNIMRNAMGGTGYVRTNGSYPAFTDPARLQSMVDSKADLVIVAGGLNELDTTGLAAACDTVYGRLAADLPNAQAVVVGPWMPTAGTKTSKAAIRDVIAERATAAGLPFVDVTDWITGTGNAGTPTGDGNADVVIGADGTHPTEPHGQDYLGVRLAGEIAAIWKSIAGPPLSR